MKALWAKYRARTERRRQERVESWSRVKAMGRLWFHVWFTIKWVVLMIAAISLLDLVIDHSISLDKLTDKLILQTIGGLFFSFAAWAARENEYRTELAHRCNAAG